MIGFLKYFQLDLMLFISGSCGILCVLTLITYSLSPKRRMILAGVEFSAMMLLIMDRCAYTFAGDTSTLGYWMVRISNFMVFFLTLYLIHSLTLYLMDLFQHEGGVKEIPRRLYICEILFAVGVLMLVISQFTGLYYTFDAQNLYHRSPGHLICYVFPLLIMLLLLSMIIQYRKILPWRITFSLLLNTIVPVIAAIVQLFAYGLSLINISVVGMAVLLYIFALSDLNHTAQRAKTMEIEFYKAEQEKMKVLFEQTAEALSSAIDAKDEYTHGHSARVAEYSQRIAKDAGKSKEECENIYFAALLHDVGKIGIPDAIINKNGRLTDEEFAEIKRHPDMGNKILSSISELPYLSIGAHFHHERYDGRGYPQGLKGEDIPEFARIIAVADAYDAMTSKRSYRDTIPQQKVREELVKGMNTQFDPEFAKIMLHLIDVDTSYNMREITEDEDLVARTKLHCEKLYHECSEGIRITENILHLHFTSAPDTDKNANKALPSLIIFDALDGRVHDSEAEIKDLLYFEYGQFRVDGESICHGARKIEINISALEPDKADDVKSKTKNPDGTSIEYDIEAVKYKDHLMIRIKDGHQLTEMIMALPDSSRFVYIALTGVHCTIYDIHTRHLDEVIGPDYIPRIAEEVDFLKDCPVGDVPNVQVDSWRTASTEGIPVTENMEIHFHTMSLPTSRLVWHCPFVSIYTSADGSLEAPDYREYVLVRLDGENWESSEYAQNEIQISQSTDFAGWSAWKKQNREGMDCCVYIKKQGDQVTVTTENQGIFIHSITKILKPGGTVYASLTGDQCALSDIHVIRH